MQFPGRNSGLEGSPRAETKTGGRERYFREPIYKTFLKSPILHHENRRFIWMCTGGVLNVRLGKRVRSQAPEHQFGRSFGLTAPQDMHESHCGPRLDPFPAIFRDFDLWLLRHLLPEVGCEALFSVTATHAALRAKTPPSPRQVRKWTFEFSITHLFLHRQEI